MTTLKQDKCLHIHAYVFNHEDPPQLASQETCIDAGLGQVLRVEDAPLQTGGGSKGK